MLTSRPSSIRSNFRMLLAARADDSLRSASAPHRPTHLIRVRRRRLQQSEHDSRVCRPSPLPVPSGRSARSVPRRWPGASAADPSPDTARGVSLLDPGVSRGNRVQSGVDVSTAASVSDTVSPGKGRTPASISYSTAPKAQMSARRSTGFPRACSGAMYAAVPMTRPMAVAGPDVSVGESVGSETRTNRPGRALWRDRSPGPSPCRRARS